MPLMSLHRSTLDDQTLTQFCLKHNISGKYNPKAPQPDHLITDCPDGFIALYTSHFDFANLRLPLSLFLISFLKECNLSISQLTPTGALKVSHFEVMCRALGYEPSIALFRRFFYVARYGDWCNVEKRRGATLKNKDMDLLKYIQKKVAGKTDGVKFTSRLLAENEKHVLERTKGICYEGVQDGGDVETGLVEPVNAALSSIKGKNIVGVSSTGGLDNIQGAGNTVLDQLVVTGNHNEPETGSEGQKKRKVDTSTDVVLVSSEESESSSDDAATHTHVQEASVSTSYKRHEATIEFTESDESSSDHCNESQTSVDVAQMVSTWYDKKSKREARLVDRIDRYRKNMVIQHENMMKLKKSSDKGRDAIRKLGKITHEHAKEVGVLERELKEARDKHADESLTMQEKLRQVSQELERVSGERQWLIEEGFGYVIKRLHKSEEFLKPLGDVESNLYAMGAHKGLVKGYANCKAGVVLEANKLYDPKAEEELKKAVREWETVEYPYVAALSQCTKCTLDELKALEPVGMRNEAEKPVGVKEEVDDKGKMIKTCF